MLGPELRFVDRDHVVLDGMKLLYLAGIDYHRMSRHPMIIESVAAAASEFGLSATGSRATTGNHTLYIQLERRVSDFFGTEGAVVLPSGYLSNAILLQAVESDFSDLFIDEGAHSSLFEAASQCDKPVYRFNHLDTQSLETQLKTHLTERGIPLLLTDGVFPARGDMPPLKEYSQVIQQYDGKMLIDDAHAMAVLGPTGKGSWEAQGVNRKSILQTGTLSKGFGVGGGIIPGQRDLIDRISEKSLAFTGCTGLALPLAAASIKSISYLMSNTHLILDLQKRSLALKRKFIDLGFMMPETPTPIFSVTHNDTAKNQRLKKRLIEYGIYPPFIHYPGSPQGGHFRFILTSATPEDQATLLLEAIESSL
jgi:8-amino-7-oxononanoate synthase